MLEKKRKQTTILISIVGFAAISLATVGFSTWFVGIKEDESNINAVITTQGSKNNTIVVDVSSSVKSINIDADVSSKGSVSGSNDSNKQMNIPLTLDVALSSSTTFNGLNLILKATKNNNDEDINIIEEANASSIIDNSSTKDLFNRDISSYSSGFTYLKLSKTSYSVSSLGSEDTTTLKGYSLYHYQDNEFKIEFGSFFNNATPESFYNSFLSSYKNDYEGAIGEERIQKRNKYLRALQAAKDELTLMSTTLNNSNLNITVEALYSFNS